MGPQISTSDTLIALPGVLNLGTAEELREKFMQCLVVGTDITLDASDVETITTPCLQVLISAGRTLESGGNILSIKNSSKAFTAALCDLGLTDIFDKWSKR